MRVLAGGLQIQGEHERTGGVPTRGASTLGADVELEGGVGDRELDLVGRVVSMRGARFDDTRDDFFMGHLRILRGRLEGTPGGQDGFGLGWDGTRARWGWQAPQRVGSGQTEAATTGASPKRSRLGRGNVRVGTVLGRHSRVDHEHLSMGDVAPGVEGQDQGEGG